jgi:hypothetical protein
MSSKILSHKSVFYLSASNLILFVTNTFFVKFLSRDLFYLTGLYLPAALFFIYLLLIVYALIKGKKVNFVLLISILIINLICFLLYSFYMSKALIVR